MYLGDNQPNRLDQSKVQYACIRTVLVDDEPMARSVLAVDLHARKGINVRTWILFAPPRLRASVFSSVNTIWRDSGFTIAGSLCAGSATMSSAPAPNASAT